MESWREAYEQFQARFRGMRLYFNRQGEVIDLLEWARLFEDNRYKVVKQTKIRRNTHKVVSTVWLGLNHGIREPPQIFETMVFNGWKWGTMEELACRRYATEEEALAGHDELVAYWSRTRKVRRMIELPIRRELQAEAAARAYLRNVEAQERLKWEHTNNHVDPYLDR